MTLEELKYEVFNGEEYKFLWEHPRLKGRLLFICLGGSYSYGTNNEDSDLDIRGVYLDKEDVILNHYEFDQYNDNNTDTVLYGLRKFLKLTEHSNPNIIEMLFCKPEHYLYVSPLGKILLDNRQLFISKRAYDSFGGYARAQLNRLENYLVRENEGEKFMTDEESKQHINRSVQNCLAACTARHFFEKGDVTSEVKKVDGKYGIYLDFHNSNLNVNDFKSILAEVSQVTSSYNEYIGRNNVKKTDKALNKHMMHLIRLFLMGNEILRDGTLHTYRENEHQLLMDIRNGKYRTKNGSVTPKFKKLLKELSDESDRLVEVTNIPDKPDLERIYELIEYPIYSSALFK